MRERWWLALCGLHAAATLAVGWSGDGLASVLTWHADRWTQHPWTLWTTAWVHLSPGHRTGNLLALGALAVLGGVWCPGGLATLAWFLAWPCVTLLVGLWPQVGHLVGLSGVIHAALAVVAIGLFPGSGGAPAARRWGGLLWLGLVVKLALEQAWRQPVAWDEGAQFSVVRVAHLCGVFAGAGWWVGLRVVASRRWASGSPS
jgi:hypothetical protein